MTAGTIVLLAIGAWSALIVVVLSLGRVARSSDDCADRLLAEGIAAPRALGVVAARPATLERPATRLGEQHLVTGQLTLLGLALAGAVFASDATQWHPVELVALLAVLAVGSDALALDVGRFRISGSLLALVLAMALLGPAPAAAIGVLCALVDGFRLRGSRPRSLWASNLATYATFPLLGGLVLGWLSAPGAAQEPDIGYALLVFAIFLAVNVLQFAMIAGHVALLRGPSLPSMFRTVYLPVIAWELASALATAGAVVAYQRYGAGVIGAFALALAVYQLLLKALLEGQRSGRKLRSQVQETGVRHERMLGLMLHTLSLRDPTAARHAAAVAHYALALARAAGMEEREQEIVHTAGLLHDIGKQGLPDSILIAERELDQADRRLIARHPVDGARLLRAVPGLEPVADTVLAHHERLDGRGYPHGRRGEAIPAGARVVAIAETYDALTAPDSYRRPVTVDEAVAELRRGAGTRYDAGLVEVFATSVATVGSAGFRRRGDADLESELRLQRHTRELLDAAPQQV